MIKVLHLRSSGGFLGAERVLVELGRELPRLGIEPVVGVPVDDGQVPELVGHCAALGIKTQVFPFSSPLSLRGMLAIRRYAHEQQIDVIHTHGYREDIYACAVLDPRRVVATNHLWKRTTPKLRFYAAADALVMRRFHTVAAVSQPIFDDMHNAGVPAHKLRLVENGISLGDYATDFPERDSIRASLGLQADDVVFGMVSSLTAEKGHQYALKALAEICRRGFGARLVIVGDGELRDELRQQARELGVESRVIFTGRRQDIPRLLQAFSVFLMPSLLEGLPMALLEAMASGLPVVATSVGDVPKLVNANIGALVAPQDVSVLVQAMIGMIERVDDLPVLGARARDLIELEYSSAHMAARYAAIYRDIVGDVR